VIICYPLKNLIMLLYVALTIPGAEEKLNGWGRV
jgi:hypothetical protein